MSAIPKQLQLIPWKTLLATAAYTTLLLSVAKLAPTFVAFAAVFVAMAISAFVAYAIVSLTSHSPALHQLIGTFITWYQWRFLRMRAVDVSALPEYMTAPDGHARQMVPIDLRVTQLHGEDVPIVTMAFLPNYHSYDSLGLGADGEPTQEDWK